MWRKFIAFLFVAAMPAILFAQDSINNNCDDHDPLDNYCPLDTWVIVLAAVAMLFAVSHLYRKQKAVTVSK